jgi:hypothetical protein
MDEDIAIIDARTRSEKLKNFLIKNKKILIYSFAAIVLIIISFYSFQIYKADQKEHVSEKYNSTIMEYKNVDKYTTILSMKEIIEEKDVTYSPLALYFIIDNNLIENKSEVNDLFDILIKKTNLEKEIKNLITYKKALYNADSISENELLEILKPLFNSNSVWKSHALYLAAEYFYFKNEIQKSKEFFNQILNTKNANQDIIKEAQKRLNRDLSD